MFGLVKGCGCNLSQEARRDWVAHVCGLCLTLREEHGQAARLTTNYDAALLSVLYEAQAEQRPERTTQVCPLRGFQRAEVLQVDQVGARYAASIALLTASTAIADHVADRDGWTRALPGLWSRLARRWGGRADQGARRLGFHPEAITEQTGRQGQVERQAGHDFLFYAEPTELAVAEAFGHTALLAGRQENLEPLRTLGRMYGRIMYLLDAYRDYQQDRARGAFNALAACYDEAVLQERARELFLAAYATLKRSFKQLTLVRPDLARSLLVVGLLQTGRQELSMQAGAPNPYQAPNPYGGQPPDDPRRRHGRHPDQQRSSCFDCCDGCYYCDPGCCDCVTCCRCGRLGSHGVDCCNCGGCDCNCCECGDCCSSCECGDCCSSCECGDCCGACDCNC
jgi:hypothetical protein